MIYNNIANITTIYWMKKCFTNYFQKLVECLFSYPFISHQPAYLITTIDTIFGLHLSGY